jgi:hypothetical protein
MPTLYQILSQNAGMGGGAYTPGTGIGTNAVPAGTNGYDYGSGSDPGEFWHQMALGNTGAYSNTTKNYMGVGGAGWNPAAASAGYLASQGGPDNAIGFNAWMSGNPQYVAAFGPPPPAGTTFDQFRQGIGKAGPGGYTKDPTLYTPPPGAPGSPGNPVGGTPPPGGATTPGTTPNTNLGSEGYPLDVEKYLDPSMAFRMKMGQEAIGTGAAAGGNFLSGSTGKALTDFGQNLASTEYANAYQRAAQQQGFKYGVDTGDRDFAYQAMVGDRNYNTQVQEFLAQLGLSGAQGQAGQQQALATAIAQLMTNSGQITSTGTAAGGTNINNTISQIVSGLQSGMTLQQIMAKFPNLGQ